MTDVVMPEMNGHELAPILGSIVPGVRLLFTSGYPADVIGTHGVIGEGVQFIQKPFSMHALARKLRQVLDGSGLNGGRPSGSDDSPSG
jgi:response regulator RpfG family c-di-GMP phosphodiesterase